MHRCIASWVQQEYTLPRPQAATEFTSALMANTSFAAAVDKVLATDEDLFSEERLPEELAVLVRAAAAAKGWQQISYPSSDDGVAAAPVRLRSGRMSKPPLEYWRLSTSRA
jgi:hypothetical protein